MAVLSDSQQDLLRRAVERGRVVAESASGFAVGRLGVAVRDVPGHVNADERVLRNGLRARARQLGDEFDEGAFTDGCRLLVREVAYEQWHRLLFARFLEVNQLLRHPEYGVAVSLEECAELARDLGEPDAWSVAARFAAEILPGIFKPSDPSVRVKLAPEDLLGLERIVTGLPEEVFVAEDALGWVYQFWQSQAKAEVNASGRKIGGADVAPVTQLFTEHYMVRFLLENSLGAWWAGRQPDSPLLAEYDYLRRGEEGSPAAGTFEGWPARAADVTVMDPCCGSGHFLVAAFGMLWRMRAEEEGLSPAEAQDAVLRDNLFGLELDARCTQIAMFALALEAWKQGGYRSLPVPNVACSGIPAKAPLKEWTNLADGSESVAATLARLHALFMDADTLGSLIDPVRATQDAGLESLDWHSIAPLLDKALHAEAARSGDPAAEVLGDAAAGIARAADLLARRYTLITTNPPYLGRGKQGRVLQRNIETEFPNAKQDLATAILQRARRLTVSGGASTIVIPQAWMIQSTYEVMRREFLGAQSLRLAAVLGEEAFEAFGIRGPRVALLIVANTSPPVDLRTYSLDVSSPPGRTQVLIPEKIAGLKAGKLSAINQSDLKRNPKYRILFSQLSKLPTLRMFARSYQGLKTGDDEQFRRFFWELTDHGEGWRLAQGGPLGRSSGEHYAVRWLAGGKALARLQGLQAWEHEGVAVTLTRNMSAQLYRGTPFFSEIAAIVPMRPPHLSAILRFAQTGELEKAVRTIDRATIISNGTILDVPFDLDYWSAANDTQGDPSTGQLDQANEWAAPGTPVGSCEPLQVAVARLLGFRWPDQEPDSVDSMADTDGIVCLPAVAGEQAAAERVRAALAASFGDVWSSSKLDELLVAVGGKAGDLEGWLWDGFFRDHCRVFQNRPFVWHIWDGRKDGFSAFVNYHRLNRAVLEKVTYTSLGWWIDRQRADVEAQVAGGEARVAAALDLQQKLALILEGEPPYDIYVRWKSLAQQPLGWDPDLDDGVRLNIRPFVEAGVLRSKFTVHWKKDRGTNPDGTERHNDYHCTLAEKRAARGKPR
jgi:hypothetical protein